MRHNVAVLAVAMSILAIIASACGDDAGARGDGRSETYRLGESLYAQECARCHGETGDRMPAAQLFTKPFLDRRGDATLMAVVADGKGTMLAFSRRRGGPFSESDTRAVVAYLNSMAGRSSPTLLAAEGEELYIESCLRCHGPEGDRIPISPLDAKGFLDSRTDAQLADVIRDGLGAMPGLGEDDERDVTALVSYLRYRVKQAAVHAVWRGRDLYVDSCLTCHGASGDLVSGVDFASPSYLRSLGDGRVISAVNFGTETGPAFAAAQGGGFSVSDTASLVAYLKSWAGLNSTAALTIVREGEFGEPVFVSNCVPCHGLSGDQVPGVHLMSPAYLKRETRTVVSLAIAVGGHEGMAASSIAAGGALTDGQIASVVDYLFAASGADSTSALAAAPPRPAGGAPPDSTPTGSEPAAVPFEGSTAAEFFDAKCAACHAIDAVARKEGGVEHYAEVLTGTMAPFAGDLSEGELSALAAYLVDPDGAAAPPAGVEPAAVTGIFDGLTATGFFDLNCAMCHAVDALTGHEGGALHYVTVITGTMASYAGDLSQEQVDALAAYLDEPEADDVVAEEPPPAATPTVALYGESLFNVTCAPCHRENAQRISAIGRDAIATTISQGSVSSGMPGFAQGFGGWLTAEQVASLADWLEQAAQ